MKRLLRIKTPDWAIALFIVFILSLTYGLLLTRLGFYMDDWSVLLAWKTDGNTGLYNLSLYDARPTSAWPYMLLFPILGMNPIAWHAALLIVYILTALAIWRLILSLWQEQRLVALSVALLTTLTPLFRQQPLAITFIRHWLAALAFFASLWLIELIPFIMGYAISGNTEKAAELTFKARELTRDMPVFLCSTWEEMIPMGVTVPQDVINVLGCKFK